MIICGAIHGIMTGQTRASWPDAWDAWCAKHAPGVRVIKKEYVAGPFPRLNWIKNHRLAWGLSNEIQLFMDPKQKEQTDEVWIVAHSNGAVIALRAASLLIARRVKVAGLILTGAACESDVWESRVLTWTVEGTLGKAVAFSSADDGVVNTNGILGWLKWPYGNLGRVGWQFDGKPWRTSRIYTRWFTGGHCSYFASDRIEGTFQRFLKEMQ